MAVFIFVFVVIAALFAMASGVWVAIALVRAISTRRAAPTEQCHEYEKSSVQDT